MLQQVAVGVIKSALPFQDEIRSIKRRFSPYRPDLSNILATCGQGGLNFRLLRSVGIEPWSAGVVMELGTGWLPIIPLLFHAAGNRLVLTDVQRLMDDDTVRQARAVLRANAAAVAADLGCAEETLLAGLDRPFDYEYRVPWSPGDLPAASVDLIVSRTVFEHIPAALLDGYMEEFARILRPGGAMLHNIDNSDHWEHHDKSLSRLNFLRYEEGDWYWKLMSRCRSQNRLRHSDYVALFRRHGWTVLEEITEIDPRSLGDLETLPLASRFRSYDRSDLATISSTFVLRR